MQKQIKKTKTTKNRTNNKKITSSNTEVKKPKSVPKETTNLKTKSTNKDTELNNSKKVIKQLNTSYSEETKKMIIILSSIILICVLVYFLSGLISGKDKTTSSKTTTKTTIQYDEILAGSTFKQTDSSYYVLYYNFSSAEATEYTTLISTYTAKTDAIKLYKVNLAKKFNTNYIATDDNINTNPTTSSELKVKDGTLIKIENGKVTDYKQTLEEIKECLS